MTPPTILRCSPSFGLNPKSIGPWNRTIQMLDFTKNSPNDSSHHIMIFPTFWAQSDIDWSPKLDYSWSHEVRFLIEWLVYCVLFIPFRDYSLDGRAKFPTALKTIDWSTIQFSLVCERATASNEDSSRFILELITYTPSYRFLWNSVSAWTGGSDPGWTGNIWAGSNYQQLQLLSFSCKPIPKFERAEVAVLGDFSGLKTAL
ncbi:unnamed protein product [Prunus armeniaca]